MPFVIAGAAALLTAVMSAVLLDETVDRKSVSAQGRHRPRLTLAEVALNRPLILLLVVAFVGQFGFGMLQSTFALYGSAVLFEGQSDQAVNLGVGLMLGVIGLGQFSTQTWLLRRLKRRYGDALLVIQGTLLRGVGMALLAVISSPQPAVVAVLFFAVGMGLMMPPLQSLATRTVDESNRGGVLGVYQSAASLAIILSTAVAGSIFVVNPRLPFWFGALLSLLVVYPAATVLKLSRQDQLKPVERIQAAD